jgi:hypothetical protein
MLKENCKIGMNVVFGRPNGEKTNGVIVKLNAKTAKVQTTENRGYKNLGGQIWSVGYGLIEPSTFVDVSLDAPVAPQKVIYDPFNYIDNNIMQAILDVYIDLSPENLCCDGELPINLVNQKRKRLTTKLQQLQIALGRSVREADAIEWEQKRREDERQNRNRNVNLPANY